MTFAAGGGALAAILLHAGQPVPPPQRAAVAPATPVQLARQSQLQRDGRAAIVRARELSARLPEGHADRSDLQRMIAQVERQLDTMSEMSEMESMRLQMTMDRAAQATRMLANLLKKLEDTERGIAKNIK